MNASLKPRGTAAEAAQGLHRIARTQQRTARRTAASLTWAPRSAGLLIVTFVAAALIAGPSIGILAAVTLTCLLAATWWFYANTTTAIIAISTVITLLGVDSIGHSIARLTPGATGGSIIALWCLTIFAVLLVRRLRRHRGNRAFTVVLADFGLLAASILGPTHPQFAIVAGLAWILFIAALRGGAKSSIRYRLAVLRSGTSAHSWYRRALRSPAVDDQDPGFDPERLAAGALAEMGTAQTLTALDGSAWRTMHSRRIPGMHADLDHLLVGPPGVVVLDSKNWSGGAISKQTLTDPDTGEPTQLWAFNGHPDYLLDRVNSTATEALHTASALRVRLIDITVAVVIHGARMSQPICEVDLYSVYDSFTGQTFDISLTLVSADAVLGWLLALPTQNWKNRGLITRGLDKILRRDSAITEQRLNDRYRRDLSHTADYIFTPA